VRKKVSTGRREQGKRFLWDETPLLGREAMIYTIDDEQELIRTLKAENEEEYNKLYFLDTNKS
jgi:hypothetical protein